MKTIYKMTIAAVLAATMGVASATTVPGIPGNVFEFSKPGIAFDAEVTGFGVDAIGNINSILGAVGGLSTAAFWGSAVDKAEVSIFEYDDAAPMIEELIFLVKGEAYDSNLSSPTAGEYVDAASVVTDGGFSTAKADFTTKLSNTGNGLYLDGKLSNSKAEAIKLMRLLNFTVTDRPTTNDGTSATDITTVVTFTGPNANINSSIVTDGPIATAADVSAAQVLDPTTSLAVGDRMDSTVELAVKAAKLNRTAFVNANNLVSLIANELKTGYILNVEKATANLKAIADHHTGFLSASLVNQAHSLKDMIKNIGYLEASVGVGKAARASCVVGTGAEAVTYKESGACTTIGGKFVTLVGSIQSVSGAEDMADDYTTALASITAFADNIISFNATVNGFDAGVQAGLINDQFGTITVIVDVDADDTTDTLYESLADGSAPTFADISGFDLVSDLGDIDGIFWNGLDLDNLDGDNDISTGIDIIVDAIPTTVVTP